MGCVLMVEVQMETVIVKMVVDLGMHYPCACYF